MSNARTHARTFSVHTMPGTTTQLVPFRTTVSTTHTRTEKPSRTGLISLRRIVNNQDLRFVAQPMSHVTSLRFALLAHATIPKAPRSLPPRLFPDSNRRAGPTLYLKKSQEISPQLKQPSHIDPKPHHLLSTTRPLQFVYVCWCPGMSFCTPTTR